jgi:hypothetical protein
VWEQSLGGSIPLIGTIMIDALNTSPPEEKKVSAVEKFFQKFQRNRSNTEDRKPQPNDISRRKFLTGLGLTIGKVALDGPQKTLQDFQNLGKNVVSPTVESAEKLSREPHAVFIDFPLDFDPHAYTLEIMNEMGFTTQTVESIGDISILDVTIFRTDDAYALYYGISEYLSRVTDHGEMTSGAWQETTEQLGQPAEQVAVHSVTDLFTNFSYERIENGGMRLRFKADTALLPAEWLSSDREEVVNCSFQYGTQGVDILMREEIPFEDFTSSYTLEHFDTGEEYIVMFDRPREQLVDITFMEMMVPSDPNNPQSEQVPALQGQVDGETVTYRGVPISQRSELAAQYLQNPQHRDLDYPSVQVTEAYSKDIGEEVQRENLNQLFALCLSQPNKLFITSSGNHNSFFYDALQQMGQPIPENLLLVGIKFPDSRPPVSDGANILVASEMRDPFVNGSSEGAAIISGIASALQTKKMNISGIRSEILQNLSQQTEYMGENYQTRTTQLLNHQDLTSYFQSE